MVVGNVFAAGESPAEREKKDLALIREGKAHLKRVIETLPGSDEAKQAQALLKAIE